MYVSRVLVHVTDLVFVCKAVMTAFLTFSNQTFDGLMRNKKKIDVAVKYKIVQQSNLINRCSEQPQVMYYCTKHLYFKYIPTHNTYTLKYF